VLVVTTVYVVMGSAGEYSDRDEWPVRAYRSKEAAQAEVTRLSGLALIYGEKSAAEEEFWDIEYDAAKFAAWKAQNVPGLDAADPSFRTSYTGTRYFIYDVSLEGE
jgi:hypothetical protein